MILVTLGSQKFQFNRLLKEVDRLIDEGVIKDSVFAQIGNSDYEPVNYPFKRFLSRDEFANFQSECSIVITHGGTGAIIGALRKGKKVIAVPRLAKYGEHVDNHQLQLLHQFDEMNLIESCYDIDELGEAYKRLAITKYSTYKSNTKAVIQSIDSIISDYELGKDIHEGFFSRLSSLIKEL